MIEYSISNGNVIQILEKYVEKGRLSNSIVQEIADVIKSGSLRIGIIGKMKAGKSSLVNSLFFKKSVLPTGLQPMTITLTEITYGTDNKVVVEILNQQDIDDLKVALNCQDEEKAKAAKEILDEIEKSPEAVEAIAEGKESVSISINQLPDYVAVGGKLSGIAKRVTIYYNDKALQGITIVDTPGFNDPIVSRGETTKNELSKCHVLLFVHTIRDTYDSTELTLAKNQIAYDGISVIIDIVNKIDSLDINEYPLPKWQTFVDSFVEARNKKIEREIRSNELKQVLLQAPCLFASPQMALIGFERPLDSEYSELFLDYIDDFDEIKSQDDMITYSNLQNVAGAINEVARAKESILLDGPRRTAVGKLNAIKSDIEGEIIIIDSKIDSLNQSINEINHKKNAFQNEISQLKSFIENTSLSADFFGTIAKSLNNLQRLRKSMADSEYSDSVYINPTVLSIGVKKRNNGHHNIVLNSFCNSVRNELEVLKSELKNNAESTINNLVGMMIRSSFSNNRIEIENILKNSLNTLIEKISIIVPNELASSTPAGKLNANALYMKDFLDRFDDDKLKKYLEPFEALAKHVVEDFKSTATKKLGDIYTELVNSAQYSPIQKDEKISQLEKEKEDLSFELKEIDCDIALLIK